MTISGINMAASVSVSGAGSPQISINGGGWTTSGSIANGQTLQVRLTSANVVNTARAATVNVGGVTDNWSVTTRSGNGCTVAAGTEWTVGIHNCTVPTVLNIAHGATAVATDGTLPTTGSATYACTDGTASVQSSTCGNTGDTTPNAFSFTDVTNAALNALITSSSVMISGINMATSVFVGGDGSPQISISGGGWTTSGSVNSGDSLRVRLTSANTFNTTRMATVNVGGVTDNWDVTTIVADTTPNAFSFVDVSGQPLNTLITSNPIAISGINTSTPVSVSGAGSPQISINAGGWVTSGSITNGQTLQMRLTSANANSTARSATVNVGGVTDNWSVTTLAGAASCPQTPLNGAIPGWGGVSWIEWNVGGRICQRWDAILPAASHGTIHTFIADDCGDGSQSWQCNNGTWQKTGEICHSSIC